MAIPPTVFAAPVIVLPASDDAICSPALDMPSATEHMALPMASDAEVAVSTITFPAPSAAFVAPLAADSMAADASLPSHRRLGRLGIEPSRDQVLLPICSPDIRGLRSDLLHTTARCGALGTSVD